jgi:cation:H+ antiporter
VVVLIYWLRRRQIGQPTTGITLDEGQNVEILFLGLATLYSFIIPLKGTLDLIDVVVLVVIFGFYAWQVAQAEHVEPDLIGPARAIGSLADGPRRLVTLLFFAIAGVAIFLVAEPFAEALIDAGIELGLDRRTLVQWLAPLASESPEFIITGVFAWRLLGAASLGALVSSKVNQWTLLVGTVPLVFNLASYVIGKPIPTALRLDQIQKDDLLLTSAQSAFAVAMLLGLHLSLWEAGMLMALFVIQFLIPETHQAITIIYIVLGVFFIFRNRAHIVQAFRSLGRKPASHQA